MSRPPGLGDTIDGLDLVCLKCGDTLDAATEVVDHDRRLVMVPGDVAICMSCGHVAALGTDMKMREMTEKERGEIANDPRIQTALNAMPYFSSGETKH